MRKVVVTMILVFVCVFAAPAAAEEGFDFSSYNAGIAVGCVIDADTQAPVSGASVSLEMAGAENQEYKAVVATDKEGCYRLPLPLGISSSKVNAKKLLRSSLFSLATNPKGVTDKTKIIYNSFANIKVEKHGYKSFIGVNESLFGDPSPFEIYLDAVVLAPAASDHASVLAADMGIPGFQVVAAVLPVIFEADVEHDASVTLKLPPGLAPELTVKLNFSDPAGLVYDGGKYEFVLPRTSQSADGTLVYSAKVVARSKNFPREFRAIAVVQSGGIDLARRVYPTIMPRSDSEKTAARHFAQGMTLAQEGDLPGAEAAFNMAIDTDKSFLTFYEQLGKVLVDQGRLDDAVDMYKVWMAADAKNYNPYVEIAKIFVKQKKYAEAYEMLTRVGKLDKKDLRTFHDYFEPLHSINQIENGKPVQIDYERSLTMLVKHTQDMDYAYALLEKADAAFPQDAIISYLYGNVLYNMGRADDSLIRYERAVAFDAGNDEYKAAYGALLLAKGDCAKVLNVLEPAAGDSKEFMVHHLAGVCNMKQGRADQALANFHNAVRYGFNKEFMNRFGQKEFIKTPYYDDTSYDSMSWGNTYFVGQTMRYYSGFSYNEGKYDFGILVAQEALGANPQQAASLLQAGVMQYHLGLYDQAVTSLDKAVSADSGMAQAYKYLCLCHRALGHQDAEQQALSQYMKLNPFDKDISAAD